MLQILQIGFISVCYTIIMSNYNFGVNDNSHVYMDLDCRVWGIIMVRQRGKVQHTGALE